MHNIHLNDQWWERAENCKATCYFSLPNYLAGPGDILVPRIVRNELCQELLSRRCLQRLTNVKFPAGMHTHTRTNTLGQCLTPLTWTKDIFNIQMPGWRINVNPFIVMLNQLPTGERTLVADPQLTYVKLTLTVLYRTVDGFLNHEKIDPQLESFLIALSNSLWRPKHLVLTNLCLNKKV